MFIHIHTFEKQVCPTYFTQNIRELNDYISLFSECGCKQLV